VERPQKVRLPDEPVSDLTTARLSQYLRCLDDLEATGVRTVSSTDIAERLQLNAAQIRKDLATFGELGVRGLGYRVTELRQHLRKILGLDRRLKVVIMGAGNLGLALADYPGFRDDGFHIVALCDTSPEKIGRRSRNGIPVRHACDLAALVEEEGIVIAILAVPPAAAQQVVDQVVAAGIRAVLNFSAGNLRVPDDVKIKNVDLSVSLETLSFFLAHERDEHP
jgi:redox-sensing transcriptional repressor